MNRCDFQTIPLIEFNQRRMFQEGKSISKKTSHGSINNKSTFITTTNTKTSNHYLRNEKPIKVDEKKKFTQAYKTDNDIEQFICRLAKENKLPQYGQKQMKNILNKVKRFDISNSRLVQMKVLQLIQIDVKKKIEDEQMKKQIQIIIEQQRKKPMKKRNGQFPVYFKQNTISRLLDYLSEDDIFNQMDTIQMLRKALTNQNKQQPQQKQNSEQQSNPSQSNISSSEQEITAPVIMQTTSNRQLLQDLIKWKNTLVNMMRRI